MMSIKEDEEDSILLSAIEEIESTSRCGAVDVSPTVERSKQASIHRFKEREEFDER